MEESKLESMDAIMYKDWNLEKPVIGLSGWTLKRRVRNYLIATATASSIKILYEDKEKGEMTCFLKWEPGATLPLHKHPAIEQSYVIEGSFYDHDGICRAGEFVWRRVGSFHETRTSGVAGVVEIACSMASISA